MAPQEISAEARSLENNLRCWLDIARDFVGNHEVSNFERRHLRGFSLQNLVYLYEEKEMLDKYRRDGTPYPPGNKGLFEWAKDIEDYDKKRVALKKLWWGGRVSTVWLGIDHSFSFNPNRRPLIFETMVFPRGGFGELDMERYSTEEEAIQGHKRMVLKWTIPFGLLRR